MKISPRFMRILRRALLMIVREIEKEIENYEKAQD